MSDSHQFGGTKISQGGDLGGDKHAELFRARLGGLLDSTSVLCVTNVVFTRPPGDWETALADELL
jgi:hypothetical protein